MDSIARDQGIHAYCTAEISRACEHSKHVLQYRESRAVAIMIAGRYLTVDLAMLPQTGLCYPWLG